MKRSMLVLSMVILLVVGCCSEVSSEDKLTGNANFYLGVKELEEDDWGPLEEQDEFGFSVDFKRKSWPVNMVISYLHSSDERTINIHAPRGRTVSSNVEVETNELSFGFRKIFDASSIMHPYAGCGLALISTSDFGSDDDTSMGLWFEGGLYFTVFKCFNIGLYGRWSQTEVILYDIGDEDGGIHYGLLGGIHW